MVCEEEEPRTLPLVWLCSLVFGLSGFLAFRSASCGIRQKKKEKEEMGEISCAWAFVELGFYYFFFLFFSFVFAIVWFRFESSWPNSSLFSISLPFSSIFFPNYSIPVK